MEDRRHLSIEERLDLLAEDLQAITKEIERHLCDPRPPVSAKPAKRTHLRLEGKRAA